MKHLASIAIAFSLLFGGGCATKSTSSVAHTATQTVIKTADGAIAAWADYVVAERSRIERLKAADPGAAMDAAHKLTVNEGKVSSAYYRYQDAARAAVNAGAATTGSPGNAAAQIAAAAAPLITLVSTLTSR